MKSPTHTGDPQNERPENPRQKKSKNWWHKAVVICGRTLVKAGNTLLAKMGEDEQQAPSPIAEVVPVYQPAVSDQAPALHPVGPDHDPAPAPNPENSPAPAPPEEEPSLSSHELLKRSVELINQFDRAACETEDENRSQAYRDASSQLIENLILSGCTSINPQEDEPFNFDCHTTNPISFPIDQCVKRTVRLGVALDDRILVKAVVEIKEQEHDVLQQTPPQS